MKNNAFSRTALLIHYVWCPKVGFLNTPRVFLNHQIATDKNRVQVMASHESHQQLLYVIDCLIARMSFDQSL